MASFRPRRLAAALVLSWLVAAVPALAQSLEQMAGQMIVTGFAGDSIDAKGVVAARKDLAAGRLGGVMYLKTNVRSLDMVERMNAAFREASPGLPPMITLDQEGGRVERLTEAVGFAETASAADLAGGTPEAARAAYAKMAKGIARLGFTVNFGPVVDLAVNPKNQVIAGFGRAYGKDPAKVAGFASAFVDAHHEAGLVTALKHFPGHGNSTGDSHEGFVDITRSWKPVELEPYGKLIAGGYADMVMVGHLYHADYAGADGEKLPASLSPAWIEGVLRGKLGFTGVVVSDDLEMGAIREHYDLKQTVLKAVRAGVDILLFSNTAKPRASLASEIQAILVAEAEADPDFRTRIEESYKRIVALKQSIR